MKPDKQMKETLKTDMWDWAPTLDWTTKTRTILSIKLKKW